MFLFWSFPKKRLNEILLHNHILHFGFTAAVGSARFTASRKLLGESSCSNAQLDGMGHSMACILQNGSGWGYCGGMLSRPPRSKALPKITKNFWKSMHFYSKGLFWKLAIHACGKTRMGGYFFVWWPVMSLTTAPKPSWRSTFLNLGRHNQNERLNFVVQIWAV